MQKLLVLYFIVINLSSFIIFAFDKFMAVQNRERVSEKKLHFFSMLGGFVGSSLSMILFHHKTAKSSFLNKHITIIFLWIVWIIIYFTQIDELNFIL